MRKVQPPYFNNRRAVQRQLSMGLTEPRNRAERRTMAKSKKKSKVKDISITTPIVKPFIPKINPQKTINKKIARAEQLNKALDTATRLQKHFKYGNGKYSMYLEPLMKRLKELGYDYDLNGFDGNLNMLYKYVRFDKLPDDTKVQKYVDKILALNWSSPENYKKMLDRNSKQAYLTNINSAGNKINPQFVSELEELMNSSAAWKIAKKDAPDSDQVKANWVALYNVVEQAFKNNLLDQIRQAFFNADATSLDDIENTIFEALKNK